MPPKQKFLHSSHLNAHYLDIDISKKKMYLPRPGDKQNTIFDLETILQ